VLKYIIKRVLLIIPISIIISVLVFTIIKLIPGDPVTLMFGRNPNAEQIARVRGFYGLDKPLARQYLTWAGNLLRGDWGTSIQQNQPVIDTIMERMPRTIALCFSGIILALIIAIPSGIISAKKHNSLTDVTITTLNLVFISVPGFWFGILLILLLSVWLHILPTSGYIEPSQDFAGWIKCMIMPTLATAATFFASLSRLMRSSMLEVLEQDYISLARIKGNKDSRIYYIHALRNSLIPVVTAVGLQIGYLMGGTVVIEKVFSYPGMGLLLLTSINQRDYPLIQGIVLIYAIIIVVVNLITDITYMFIDPKIKFGHKKV
jgi:peptide/nickel transport system permease protein